MEKFLISYLVVHTIQKGNGNVGLAVLPDQVVVHLHDLPRVADVDLSPEGDGGGGGQKKDDPEGGHVEGVEDEGSGG